MINAQLRAVQEGRKPAMLVTKGAYIPETDLPRVEIPLGLLIYRDESAKTLAESGFLGEALGYGINFKPQTNLALTVRDETGQVIHDVLTDGRQSVVDAGLKVAGKGSIEYRSALDCMLERHQVKTLGNLLNSIGEAWEIY